MMSRGRQVAVFAAILLAYLATASGHLDSPDAELQFRTTQALARGGTTAIEPIDPDGFATRIGRGGGQYAQYGIGMPLMALPFLGMGVAIDGAMPDIAVHRVFWPTTQYHGGSAKEWRLRLGASFLNQVVGALLALLFLRVALRLGLGGGEALMATLLLSLGTYHWAHSRTFFSEAPAVLFVFGAFALLLFWHQSGGDGWKLPLAAGLLAGFAVLVRKDSALFFPGLCIYAILPAFLASGEIESDGNADPADAGRRRFDRARLLALMPGAALAAGGMIAGIAAHFLVAWWQFGDPTALGYDDQPEGIQFTTPFLAGLYGFLFSAGKGLFFFSPALILAAIGLPALRRRAPIATMGAALTITPFFVAMCMWQNWPGGWCWGPRHIFQIHVFLALGFIGWLAPGPVQSNGDAGNRARRVRRTATWLFLAIGAGVQIYGSSQSAVDFYMTHFRIPHTELTARSLYAPGEAAGYFAAIQRPNGSMSDAIPLSMAGVTAPINDSIYVPQNSQWYGYARMWGAGLHDFFWLHALQTDERGPGLLPVVRPADRDLN